MRMKFLLGILVVAAFLSAAPAGHADQFNFTFTTNLAACATYGFVGCAADSGSGTLTTPPLAPPTPAMPLPGMYAITDVTGAIDGFQITSGSGGVIEDNCLSRHLAPCYQLYYHADVTSMVAGNRQWYMDFNDLGPWGNELSSCVVAGCGLYNSEPVNLEIVHVPEPSTVVLVILGICLLWIIRAVPKRGDSLNRTKLTS